MIPYAPVTESQYKEVFQRLGIGTTTLRILEGKEQVEKLIAQLDPRRGCHEKTYREENNPP